MALSVHNSTCWQFISAVLLIAFLNFSVFPQDTQPTLEAVLAINEPAARLEALQKFLQAQPNAPQADTARAEITRVYAYLGEMQLANKDVDGAIQNFKQAIAAFPKQVEDKFFEEVAARIPLAVSVRGYRTEAILLAREMEARFGAEAKRLAGIGEFYLSLEAPLEALRALHSALKLTPDDARIHRLLGAAHRVNLNLDKAAEQYTAAIKADPKDSRAYFELANLQRARGRYEIAINLYNHQLGLEPEHAPSLKGLALCHIAQGREERANELLAQAAKLTNADLSRDYYLQTQLALTWLARGNVAKARQSAEAAVAAESRFSWARLAAAEVELAEGKYFEAERNIIAAMKYADFPTLRFTLGKIYLAVEDFEGALEEFGKAFSYKAGKFQTRLGGVQEVSAETVAELLAPERQASMFQAEPITTEVEFKLAENLARFDVALRRAKLSFSQLPSTMILNQKNNQVVSSEIEKNAEDFVETEGSRKPFRWLYAAERLTQSGQALETVLKLTDQALETAEPATAPEGSLRDYPNYDRDGRLRVFRGRALTLRGRALIKLNRATDALATLEQAIESYGSVPERKRAQWQLALAKESLGQPKEALDLYIAAYEPPDKSALGSDLNRTVIEGLYRKVHGSLNGLNERIGKAQEATLVANLNPIAPPKPTTPSLEVAPVSAEKTDAKPTEAAPPEPIPATAPPVTAEAATKASAETGVEKAAVEATIPTEAKPEATPEPAAAATSKTMIVLPETSPVALIIGDLAGVAPQQELQLPHEEDAPPPNEVVTSRSIKPTEEPPAAAAPVVLPEIKAVSLALMMEDIARVELAQELSFATEDAPVPTLPAESTATATTPTEIKSEVIPAPIALPEAVVTVNVLLPTLEETPHNVPESALVQIEGEDAVPPTPPVAVAAQPVTRPEPSVTNAEANPSKKEAEERATTVTQRGATIEAGETTPSQTKSAQLSDTRVAELEKAISRGINISPKEQTTDHTAMPVGKKGDGADAIEEAATGHLEGDAPVRLSKPLEPVLPAGESGRVIPTTPKINPRSEDAPSEGLPSEVEARAKAMGQSAGKLSAGAAMEVESPEKPVGQGRKGTRNIEEEEEKTKSSPRPRRVKQDAPKPSPRNP